jgi:hypothetical protein
MGSGIVPLRPLTIGEIYDGSIRVIRANPRALAGFGAAAVGIFSVLALVPQVLALNRIVDSGIYQEDFARTATSSDVGQVLGSLGIISGLTVLVFFVTMALVSTMAAVAVDSAVRGLDTSPSAVLAWARKRMFAAVGLMLLILIILPVVAVLCLLPSFLIELATGSSGFTAFLAVIGVIAALVLLPALFWSRWAVAVPVLTIERRSVIASLRRSSQLVKGSAWRVFGITFLGWIIVSILWRVFLVPFTIVASLIGPEVGRGDFVQTLIQLMILNVGSIIAGAILLPFVAGVSALLHLDLRIRREGLDVDLLRPDGPR